MKKNMFKNGIFTIAIASAMSFTACTGDLDVTPIDPNLDTPENVLTSTETYNQLLAKCYSALSVSSPDGDSGDPDIKSIDGGFGQYLRALVNLQELPTDEVVMNWNDQTIKDLHGLCWSTNDVFVTAAYARMFYQISLCNEVIRRIDAAGNANDATMQQYRAEACALRGLSYYHVIDLFGNVPFVDETSVVGGANPERIARADLFDWMVTDLESAAEVLPANPEKYRAGKGLAYMLLAKLYLNAKVYTGTAQYDKCAEYCKKVIDLGYTLEAASDYYKMFCADNDQMLGVGHELIFSVYQDHLNTKAYGGTTYIINAACGGQADYAADFGLGGSGWAGFRLTPEFVNKFSDNDQRAVFYEVKAGGGKAILDLGEFEQGGYSFLKFTNLKADGTILEDANSFTDTDFPVFRLGDVYLMLAECQVVGGVSVNVNGHDGLWYLNQIRNRAGLNSLASATANDIIDERARELAWECHRRSDLVRFNLLTSDTYIWAYKGMNSNIGTAHAVDAHFNLYPIPSSDIMSNSNLEQNAGY
ncbi:MAG: RagB/SusD family nutrient uptake outer membrane protein [Prevotella sp.]|nr:RagB/SusD family nutrient uptake outer membrane protein [Prevotella sp.]